MPIRTVKIIPGSPPRVKPRTLRLHKGKNEQAKWICRRDFVVCFQKETPFRRWYFHPANPGSGPPKVAANGRKKYKYSVETGGRRCDPIIIID
ncbi:MAG: hypothetical protein ACE5HL_04295 [Terriglobia bacterium]